MSHGAASQSITIVTAYDTLGEEGLKHSLVQTSSTAIFLDPGLIKPLTNILKDIPSIKHIIYNSDDEVKQEDLDKLKNDFSHISVQSIEDLRKQGEENLVDPVPPKPEDLCCIMYTSGSTGPPKGVSLTQANVIAASKFNWEKLALMVMRIYANHLRLYSCWCQRNRWPLHQYQRLAPHIPPASTHPRVHV